MLIFTLTVSKTAVQDCRLERELASGIWPRLPHKKWQCSECDIVKEKALVLIRSKAPQSGRSWNDLNTLQIHDDKTGLLVDEDCT